MDGWIVSALLFLASSLAFGAAWNLRTHLYERRAYQESVKQRFEAQNAQRAVKEELPHPTQVAREEMQAFQARLERQRQRRQTLIEQEGLA